MYVPRPQQLSAQKTEQLKAKDRTPQSPGKKGGREEKLSSQSLSKSVGTSSAS